MQRTAKNHHQQQDPLPAHRWRNTGMSHLWAGHVRGQSPSAGHPCTAATSCATVTGEQWRLVQFGVLTCAPRCPRGVSQGAVSVQHTNFSTSLTKYLICCSLLVLLELFFSLQIFCFSTLPPTEVITKYYAPHVFPSIFSKLNLILLFPPHISCFSVGPFVIFLCAQWDLQHFPAEDHLQMD